MTGDEQRRHCARCDRDVHSLSGLSPEEAERLAARGICGEYVADDDGAPIFADRTVPAPTRPMVFAALLMAACAPHIAEDDLDPIEPTVVDAPQTVIPDAEASHDLNEGECDDEHQVFTRGVVVSLHDLVITEVIDFPDGSAHVGEHSTPILDDIAEVLAGNPEIRKVLIVGHSDDVGTQAKQNEAGRDRAEAVRNLPRRARRRARATRDREPRLQGADRQQRDRGRADQEPSRQLRDRGTGRVASAGRARVDVVLTERHRSAPDGCPTWSGPHRPSSTRR